MCARSLLGNREISWSASASMRAALSRLRMMLNAIGKEDTLSGLKMDELEKLEECVRKTIARLVTPDLQTPIEFGHKVFLAESARGLITQYDVLDGNPVDEQHVVVSLERHKQTFGDVPRL
jgi:hypothetical protein